MESRVTLVCVRIARLDMLLGPRGQSFASVFVVRVATDRGTKLDAGLQTMRRRRSTLRFVVFFFPCFCCVRVRRRCLFCVF